MNSVVDFFRLISFTSRSTEALDLPVFSVPTHVAIVRTSPAVEVSNKRRELCPNIHVCKATCHHRHSSIPNAHSYKVQQKEPSRVSSPQRQCPCIISPSKYVMVWSLRARFLFCLLKEAWCFLLSLGPPVSSTVSSVKLNTVVKNFKMIVNSQGFLLCIHFQRWLITLFW